MDRKIYWTYRKPSEDLPVTPYRVEVEIDMYAGCFCRVVGAVKPTFLNVDRSDLFDDFASAQAAAVAECDAIAQEAIGRRGAIDRAEEPS